MLYSVLPRIGLMIGGFFLVINLEIEIVQMIGMWIFLIMYFVISPLDYYLIIKWSREYNKNAI